jgi:hypothetical protein
MVVVAELFFLKTLVDKYDGKHTVYSDGGRLMVSGRRARERLELEHIDCIRPTQRVSIERTNDEYLKDRVEEFDDYYPCKKKKEKKEKENGDCDLSHARN